MSAFETKVIADLKEKGLAESSISLYIRSLEKLNGGKPFSSFAFLTKMPTIMEQINRYKPNTQRSILISIVSVLNAVKTLPKSVSKWTNKYYEVLKAVKRGVDATEATGEKTETQKENWLSWDEVETKMGEVQNAASAVSGSSIGDLNKLLDAVVLGLYVYLRPRRNKDYIDMVVTYKAEDAGGDVNILDLSKGVFIFRNYKTASTYGTQTIDVPAELMPLITNYLQARGVLKELKPETGKKRAAAARTMSVPFLVQPSGKPFNVNGITRILNRIFGNKVGSSLLRHIYLTGKYGKVLEEQKKDAEAMANSVDIQNKTYIKNT
jgi:hypothetical protein